METEAVTVELFSDPRLFLVEAADYLAADPVVSTVVATIAERWATQLDATGALPDVGYPAWWALVRDGRGVVGAAMRTAPFPPYPLFVLPMPEAGARELARILHARGERVGGANGALPAARHLAEETAHLWGATAQVHEHTRLFELGDLITPPSPRGHLRPARASEAELALGWFKAFHLEADEQAGREPDPAQGEHFELEDIVERIENGRVHLWVDDADEPVHLTGFNPPAFGVARVGPVYTPKQRRGQGYAGAAVAAVSQRLLDQGARVCLFTDQANPVSNAIYQRLGYRAVVDMANIVVR